MKAEAEILINGPKGFSTATLQVRDDGKIEPWAAEAALAHALNLYNDMPDPKLVSQDGPR